MEGLATNWLRWEQANPPEEWAGEFFRGKDLNEQNLAGHRGGGQDFLDKDWGTSHEGGIAIGDDDFSDRWTTTRYFDEPGVYEFVSQADDGVRVWVDNQLVIDQWQYCEAFTTNKALLSLDEGYHRIRVEHFENQGAAANKLTWEKVAGQPNSSPWTAKYFNNRHLQGAPILTRTENSGLSGFDFDWGLNSPDNQVNNNEFSARWTTHQELGGTYTFNVGSDDGVRFYINGEKIIDQWQLQSFTTNEATITLPPGIHTLQMEYFEAGGDAAAKLDWQLISNPPQVEIAPDFTTAYKDLADQLGDSAIGLPISSAEKQFNFDQATGVITLAGQFQEFRGTQGRGALLQKVGSPDVTYVFGKLWEAYKQAGGPEKLGYPLSSQKDLGNGAYELELPKGRLFWAPGMSNPTYYEYAYGQPNTLTIPADAWRGEYFTNRDWAGDPLVVRQDSGSGASLKKAWESYSPAPGLPQDNFSVKWTSNRPFDRGTYRFKGEHDDGFRVEVNGQKPIDRMGEIATRTTGYTTFIHSHQYPIEVRHREYGGHATAILDYEKASDFVVGLEPDNRSIQEIIDAFHRHGGYDRVGIPTNDVHSWGNGLVQDFDHGSNGWGIVMKRHGSDRAYYTFGDIWRVYREQGGSTGKLGYPTSDFFDDGHGNTAQEFETNRITRRPNGETFVGGYVNGHLLPGDFYSVWKKYNLGTPDSDVRTHSGGAKFQYFIHPTLGTVSIVQSSHGTWPLIGAIRSYYVNTTKGLNCPLGAPKSAEYDWNGYQRQDFANGYILWKSGQSAVGYRPDGFCCIHHLVTEVLVVAETQ